MNKEDRLYKLSQGSDTAVWAHDEIIKQDKRIAELEKERETQEQALKELLYCCDGLSTEYAERNYGNAEIWARHIHESYVKYQELQEQGE